MIEFKSDHGKVRLNAAGEVVEIATDMTIAINTVWQQLYATKPSAAMEFREYITCGVQTGLCFPDPAPFGTATDSIVGMITKRGDNNGT